MEAPHARSARTSSRPCAQRYRPRAHQRVNSSESRNGRQNRRRAVRRPARRCLCPIIRAHFCTRGRPAAGRCPGSGRGLPSPHRRPSTLTPRTRAEVAVRRILDIRRQPGEAVWRVLLSGGAGDLTSARGRCRGRRDPHEHRSGDDDGSGLDLRHRDPAVASDCGRRTRVDVQHHGGALLHPAGRTTRRDGR